MENNPFVVVESFHFIHEIMYMVSNLGGQFEVVVHIGDDGSLLVYGESDSGLPIVLDQTAVEAAVKATGAKVVQLYQKTDKTWMGRVACHYGEVSL